MAINSVNPIDFILDTKNKKDIIDGWIEQLEDFDLDTINRQSDSYQ